MIDSKGEEIIEELAAAARGALPWVPNRSPITDGGPNIVHTRLATALREYDKWITARSLAEAIDDGGIFNSTDTRESS